MAKHRQNLYQIAQQTFGYDSLRPAQQEVIKAVLEGQDTLAVMTNDQ
ncbi:MULTISPECIES: hypothetical protein [unclassified Tolypothrix]|nr:MULTISPECIES: hypothetical protein [unclassified Tolypothrix]BAY88591.1 ATP-dependent DNA helicase [Microchaete diplosiphon NIES-3275]EKE97120.1 hypothetical protein FDUTEX481_05330 [Tolypothrix sp. PCC 7601]MBE9082653.1 hypothetical protein [Tolypothrix sp. LEGE 11397]UYD29263.1 hypothetical protein HGR01_15205 [Tolypothrix sp. PCC 7712]UYD34826.1 hypothetical protein HG267_03125 [Tolypothrix sp. PCC 7601]